MTAICPGFINTPIAWSTRFAGGIEDPKARARLVKAYSRVHSPDKVGAAIVRAIAANRAVVPVGFESVIAWYVHRLAPIAVQQFLLASAAGAEPPAATRLLPLHGLHFGHPFRGRAPDGGCPSKRRKPNRSQPASASFGSWNTSSVLVSRSSRQSRSGTTSSIGAPNESEIRVIMVG